MVTAPGDAVAPEPVADEEQAPAVGGAVAIAADAAEAIRVLNQATHPARRWPGLNEPVDVYEMLGALSALADRLQQTCSQLARFIEHRLKSGLLEVAFGEHAEDPEAAVTRSMDALEQARLAAAQLAQSLSDAQATVIAMGPTEERERSIEP